MAKKKNRKKELKRQQKLDIKVISEEEAAWTEIMAKKPTFVERRQIQNFDELHIFVENGIRRSSDFKKWTEKEVLALKGIGPVTVKKLKENGIKFKNEK